MPDRKDRRGAAPPAGATPEEEARPARRGRLTLSQLAETLKVSTATISLALRDSPLVAEATRERVKQAARERGYIYNRSAAALRTARSNVIGVAVHDILNPYFAEIFRALEDALGENDQVVFICNHRDDVERQRVFTQALLQHRADGLVLCPSVGTEADEINQLVETGLPVTLICRDLPGVNAPVIRGDDITGGRRLTEQLIAQGHRHIAMIGGRVESSSGVQRRAGWARALQEAGLDVDSQLYLPELMTRADGYEVVDAILAHEPRPTAVFCFNDMIARGLVEALRRAGLNAGPDIAVAGYDDIIGAATSTPSLTSVNNGAPEIGERAARMILAQISGESVAPERVLIAPTLKLRESTAQGPAANTQ
ncbi:LacI family DNA-binding transcriptional regulator [Breoghania sp. L-A4]|uniref:LacI family DNA-binding transcriptional regulator n=1 Tax=Breoghania sp. L-A4 TaxID=2304600 RepID=UPI000E35EC1A|nr:LacI family DNA-binding transcriptional regulator [Breoghania sp. L-A4]AXS41914.1 LacI family transcriptional regulator [Breoghania sp. L-A4]